jgi:hypothetical protein
MGTELVSNGELPVLVAADWYDDGPIEQLGRFEALRDGSALHEALAQASPAALTGLLEQALAPVGLNAVTVPLVVGLAPLKKRPELAAALLESVHALALPHASKVAVATLALGGGALDGLRRFVDHALLPGLERRFHRRRPPDNATLELLLALDEASLVTRLLARSRPRGTRSWVGELNLYRLWFAARAHQSLHRRRLAISLYERVLTLSPPHMAMHTHASEQLALLRG